MRDLQLAGITQRIVGRLDITRTLVLINTLTFAAMVLNSSWRTCLLPSQDVLLRWGANLGALTVNGQYWRLITSMFIHAGILHLGLNMYGLWVFGPTVSKAFGTGRFLAIYFLSGLAGALASTVWNPAQISAGASGALVGMAGAMLAVLVRGTAKDAKANGFSQPLIFFGVICASLLYGFFNPDIDNAAHIGGLAGGFLCGLVLQPGKKPQSKVRQIIKSVAFCSIVIAIIAVCLIEAKADKRSTTYQVALCAIADLKADRFEDAYFAYDRLLKSELNSSYFVGRAMALVGLKQYQMAIADCEKAMAMSPKDPAPFLTRARAFHEQGDDKKAVKDLSVVICENPKHAAAYNSRSWSEIVLGRSRQALDDANEALRLDPVMAEALDTRGVVYFCLNKRDKALIDFEQSIYLKPKDGASYFHRAMIYDQIGNTALAEKDRTEARILRYKPEPWELKLQGHR